MEMTLTLQVGTQVLVTCNDQTSHVFDLLTLVPGNNGLSHPRDDPVAYGKAIYEALFPPETTAWSALNAKPDRILFVSTDDTIDAIPWEYAYGPDGFTVLECHFVRGLPADQRIALPTMNDGLHIVAVPSNPLSHAVEALNIDGEWMRLKEIIRELPYAITLERVRPPTLERLGLHVTNQQHRIVHFMGHGGQHKDKGAILYFEQENGGLDPVTARDFMRQLRGNVFLVTLNSCTSAAPGETHLNNLAAALVGQKTPYALGMRFRIPDEDALSFSRTFYSYLARGSSVEEAVYRVRLALSRSKRQWMIGVPVLYTSLSVAASGFASSAGTPEIQEHQPQIEASALPRADGAFQGRVDELKQLGELLTGDNRPCLITIHSIGGQGKTALAREAVKRFAFSWPGGVWATTLENLPSREVFVNDLARFLDIATQEIHEPGEIERQVLRQLSQRRILLVLDNFETLINVVEASDLEALRLVQFIKQLPSSFVSLLVTSREHLGWSGEAALEIGGLSPEEGANLFRQSAPQRTEAIEMELAQQLSQKVDGHPFSLLLLGGAFNASAIPLSTFLTEYEERLVKTENKYVGEHHRHRTFYTSIETSVRYLDEEHCQLLSGLWVFHAPFIPQTAAAIFDSLTTDAEKVEGAKDIYSPIFDRLHTLWQRGLLNYETFLVRGDTMSFYRLPPTMRTFVEQFLTHTNKREILLTRFGEEYAKLVRYLRHELDRSVFAAPMALVLREDIERGASYVDGVEQGYYLLHWGWILQRLGDIQRGLKLAEKGLEIGEERDQKLKLQALNYIAGMYQQTGKLREAIMLHEQALPELREVGDRAGEGVTLSNMAMLYQQIGKPEEALKLYKQAIPIRREVGDRAGEAATLSNMGGMYADTGERQEALKFYEQALPLMREANDRAGEAARLYGMANLYQSMQHYSEACIAFEQSITLEQMVFHRAGEVAGLVGLALLLYQHLGRSREAIEKMEQALTMMEAVDLSQDVSGRTRERLQQFLNDMRRGIPLGQAVALSGDHRYAPAIAKTQMGIPRSNIQNKRTPDIKFGKKRMNQRKGKHKKK
jgi:tetratricopeptide (TPR) repeat protein